jgi:hypothetical protein
VDTFQDETVRTSSRIISLRLAGNIYNCRVIIHHTKHIAPLESFEGLKVWNPSLLDRGLARLLGTSIDYPEYTEVLQRFSRGFKFEPIRLGDLGEFAHVLARIRRDFCKFPVSWMIGRGELVQLNRAISIYEQLLSEKAKVVGPHLFDTKTPLRGILEPYMNAPDVNCYLDDADVIVAALCGIESSVIGTGLGLCFHPSLLRKYLVLLEKMNLSEADTVIDFGGGDGVKAAIGSRYWPATFISFEGARHLHEIAERTIKLCSAQDERALARGVNRHRARAHHGDFLKDKWPEANKYYCFEPLYGGEGGQQEAQFVDQLIERSRKGKIVIGCYSLPPYADKIQRLLREARQFKVRWESLNLDSVVFVSE